MAREGADVGVPSGGNDTSTVSEAALRATVETKVFAVMAWTQTLSPLMRRSPAGRLVKLSSILSSLTLHSAPPWPTDTSKACAYDASQPALNAFTVHPSAALQDTPLKGNAAPPGSVQTALGGAGASLEGREGGQTSVHLAMLPTEEPTGGSCQVGEPLPWECVR
jgi:NAD(P)-dependent dehydrogenase (short-subunit alcohol dehydrogenase family)